VRTPAGRIALVGGTVAVLVVLFLVLRRSDESEPVTRPTQVTTTGTVATTTTGATTTAPTTAAQNPPGPRRIPVTVRDGRVRGGVRTVRLQKGDRFVLVVRADVSDHVHVHGYDKFADVGPGRPAQIGLRATIAGRFEVELEDRHFLIVRLEVRP
jgi:hypothetical protein